MITNIYDFSYSYLLDISKDYLSREKIDNFIEHPDAPDLKSLSDVYEMLLVVLQDFQMYPKVINYSERKKEIKETINFPDFEHIAKLDLYELSELFIKKYKSRGKMCWIRYCKGIISGARFLSQFKDLDDFLTVCDSFDSNDVTREAYALFLQTKIDNMGFAIACNWLKELGYFNYPKPDQHMKDICCALGTISQKRKDIDCFEAMLNIAKQCGVEPYKLDKVWWLICSGNYYRYRIQLPNPKRNKALFLGKLSEQYAKGDNNHD